MKDDQGNNHYAVDPFADDAPDAVDILPTGHERGESSLDDYGRGLRDAGLIAVDHWKGVFSAMLTFKGDARFVIRCTIAAHGFGICCHTATRWKSPSISGASAPT